MIKLDKDPPVTADGEVLINVKLKLPVVIFPDDNVRIPAMFMLEASKIPAELLTLRLLKVVAVVPPMVCCELPLKLTVPDPAVIVPPLFVQLPVTINVVADPPLSVFPEASTDPLIVWPRLVPRFSVPPEPDKLSPPEVTLPENVAVPAVLVILTVPVVENPAIVCTNMPLEITIGAAFAVNVPPLLIKSPPKVN